MKEKLTALTAEDSYFIGLKKTPNSDLYVDGIKQISLLASKERFILLQNVLNNLKTYKVKRICSTNKVKEGWQIIEDFLSEKSQTLIREDTIPLLYGSMIFDDPKNLDYDLFLVSNHKSSINYDLLTKWELDLDRKWQKIGTPGHISYLSLDAVQINASLIHSNCAEYAEKYAEMVDFDFMNVGIVLIGESFKNDIFSGVNSQIPLLQDRIINIANKSSILMGTIIRNLQETLIVRETRRNGLCDRK